MSTEPTTNNNVSDYYEGYKEVQAETIVIQSRKTRNCIFIIAAILFTNDMIGYARLDLISAETILYSLIIPAVLIVCGFLAIKEPLMAIIAASVVFAGLFIWSIVKFGGVGAVSGIIL